MISAVVLTPDTWAGDDLAREREIVARSMVWLVSAVIGGVVRDVTLAVPAGLGLSELSEQSGCELVQADHEAERLGAAVAGCREDRVLVLVAGYQPESGVIDEIDTLARRAPLDGDAVLLAEPDNFWRRLFPQRAPVVGTLLTREAAAKGDFRKLAGLARRGTVLATRARPIR